MGVIELVDQSAASALQHASSLQTRLRMAGTDEAASHELEECRSEMHRLVGDIVSLRNAAELLKRSMELPTRA